jgi:hypothetical protein
MGQLQGMVVLVGLAWVSWVFQLSGWMHERQPPNVSLAASEVDQGELFLYAASLFMPRYKGGEASLYWVDISQVPEFSSALKSHGFSNAWHLEVLSDGTWYACTPLGERALGMFTQLLQGQMASSAWVRSTKSASTGASQWLYLDDRSRNLSLCQG